MESLRYYDLELEIAPFDGFGYPVAVLHSPSGQGRAVMRFPFDQAVLEQRLLNLEEALWGLPEGDAARVAQHLGTELFDALIEGQVRTVYDRSLQQTAAPDQGLRIKLRVHAPELATVPWEFLYDPRQGAFLALSRHTPVVRYLELPLPDADMGITPPLRVLGMVSNPADVSAGRLDVEGEKTRLEKAIRPLREGGLVELTWVEGQTWRDLQVAMQGGPWHIFHYIGHATFDPDAGGGAVILVGDDGLQHSLSATQLAGLLADQRSLRMVLLNACSGARGTEGSLFSSTASVLVQRGLPAVLAMQYAISDLAAIEFTTSFYSALTSNLPVDAAVSEARKAISLAMPGSIEWGTPVLFMRAPDGVIWQVEREGPHMSTVNEQNWWDKLPDAIAEFGGSEVDGDVTIAVVGAGAKNVAVGKGITQIVTESLGEPTPDDKQIIAESLAGVKSALQDLQGQIDPVTWVRADDRLPLLEGELTKIAEDETPSGKTIITVGDWLLDHVPEMKGALGRLFATSAVGRVVGRAGETAVHWIRERFGS